MGTHHQSAKASQCTFEDMQELSSLTSSVQSWIDLVPTPRKRKAQNEENIAGQARRKRHQAPLQDVSINIAAHCVDKPREGMSASSSKHGRAGRGTGGPKTPRRSGRKTPTEQPILPYQEDAEKEGLDADLTPRGPFLPEWMLPASSTAPHAPRAQSRWQG